MYIKIYTIYFLVNIIASYEILLYVYQLVLSRKPSLSRSHMADEYYKLINMLDYQL